MYGTEIKYFRIREKLTQQQLAKNTKIPQRTISWIESDKGIPTIDNLVKLADYYKISLDELIGRDFY